MHSSLQTSIFVLAVHSWMNVSNRPITQYWSPSCITLCRSSWKWNFLLNTYYTLQCSSGNGFLSHPTPLTRSLRSSQSLAFWVLQTSSLGFRKNNMKIMFQVSKKKFHAFAFWFESQVGHREPTALHSCTTTEDDVYTVGRVCSIITL